MSDDGGPAYPCRETFVTLKDGHFVYAEDYRWCPGMSLRERFAVAIVAGSMAHPQSCGEPNEKWTFDEAQKLTNEAMGRRIQDAAVAQNAALQAGAEAMKDDPLYADGDEVKP